ncbi:Uncharacterized protein AC500_4567 [Pseudomonas amygdali pv. lachrymans]|nr:Uncharacterized protein AC500_4567 [Pseudomonas amygdali pv. lachrymans]RMM04270.1 hypothetical protein ALQ85_03101 [Pseudomonas syringae]RMO78037.1 hypothetical protein ALQ34_02627 [Pseudomonas syringae pv. maculicola]
MRMKPEGPRRQLFGGLMYDSHPQTEHALKLPFASRSTKRQAD